MMSSVSHIREVALAFVFGWKKEADSFKDQTTKLKNHIVT